MRVIQKTIVDFDTINSYARTLEFLGSKKAASDLRNIKQDILSAYDKQAPNYSALMDYKTLSSILGHYSVAFTMDTYVHSMDEHKRHEMDKMDDLFGMQYNISVENQPYPVLCTLSQNGCTAHVPDFPKITTQASTLDAALLEVKQQIQKALRQYKNPPIPTKQEQIVVPQNSVLVLVKAG